MVEMFRSRSFLEEATSSRPSLMKLTGTPEGDANYVASLASISRIGNSALYRIEFADTNPKIASAMANHLASNLVSMSHHDQYGIPRLWMQSVARPQ
jgi:hypothetical protein